MDIKKIILEKAHDLISDITPAGWDSVNEQDKQEDSLILAYVNGVCELSDALIKTLESTDKENNNELVDW